MTRLVWRDYRLTRVLVVCVSVTLLLVCLVSSARRSACAGTAGALLEVNVDGHRVHVLVVGDSGPTVVLESGLPGGLGWNDVRKAAGRFATVVTYDRTSIGKSEPGPLPRATPQPDRGGVRCRSAGLPPEYVLVGQSMGGPYVRVFAARYPQDVSGLVLVDPTHAELVEPLDDVKAWFAVHHPQDWPRVDAVAAKCPKGMDAMLVSCVKAVEEFLDGLPEPHRVAVAGKFWSMFGKRFERGSLAGPLTRRTQFNSR